MYSFAGKVVFITGSSTGIGHAAALAFADHGADVIVHCHTSLEDTQRLAGEIESKGRKTLLVQGDVAIKSSVDEMMEQINQQFGRIDVLVNNAGSMVQRSRLEDMEEEVWDRVMDVNLKSVYLVTKAALPLLKKGKQANVINITSIAARHGGGIGSFAYAASKGGVSTMTRGFAKDLVEYGIRVNGVAPGIITTPFHERFTPPDMMEKMVQTIPMKRAGTPDETVGSLLFLASDHAQYLTGEIIEVNGGQLMD